MFIIKPDIIYPDCGYYNEERDDEFAPSSCMFCYRAEICYSAFNNDRKKLLEDNLLTTIRR